MQRTFSIRQKIWLNLGTLLGLLMLSPFCPAETNQSPTDQNRRLTGSYGFAATGYFAANFDNATQTTTGAVAERVGVYYFDGTGKCKIHSIANKAGLAEAVFQDTEDCTYKVLADGTGEVNAKLGGKSFLTFFVLVNDDKEFMFTRREGTSNPTDLGGASLIFAIAKKQSSFQ